MKARASEVGTFAHWDGGAETFLFKGTNGRWRGVLNDEELALYDRAVAERLSPAAAAWLERGRAALAPT